jgi:ATP-binding cassette, subfamily B, multidrug efflux pump
MIKLLRLLQPFRWLVAAVFVLVFLQALADLNLPTLLAHIVDDGIVKGKTDVILRIGGEMLLVALGGTLASIAAAYYSARAGAGFGRVVRARLFGHVERFSLHEFDQVSTASLITRTTNDTTQVQMVLIIAMRMILYAPIMLVGGIILAVRLDRPLTLVLVAIVPVLGAAIYLIMRTALPLFQSVQKKIDTLNLILDEGLTGVRVIRAFDRVGHEERRFDTANLDLTDVSIRVNRVVAAMLPVMMLVLNVATIAILWFGSIRADAGQLQVGDLIAFMQYALLILFAVMMASMMFIMVPRAAASADRINAVLAMPPSVTDAAIVHDADTTRGQRAQVEFQDVTFRYPGAEEPALAHISFTARPGQVTAIIGGTGAGKSTLIGLVPRFYDVESGRVLVDGVDVREQSQEHLRAKIGFVPQRAILFSGTVAENIRFGAPEATDDAVCHAAEVAQAAEFITGMPGEYDASVAQGGTDLSGGQKQRLSIARAIARHPEVYIFDDSFSALDYITDARLRARLRRETVDATVLIVAQRVSTVMDADQIIVLDEGRVAGIGTHRELLQTSPEYREIVESQLAEEVTA